MAEENRYAVATGNWTDTATWSTSSGGLGGASVPDTDQHAIIESGVNVTINADDEIKSLTVNSGGTLTGNSSYSLTLNDEGDSTYGTAGYALKVVGALGTNVNIILTTQATTIILVSTSGAGGSLHDLTINHASCDAVQFSHITLAGDLTITAGALSTGSDKNLTVADVVTVNGSLTGNGSTLLFGSLKGTGTFNAPTTTVTIDDRDESTGKALDVDGMTIATNDLNVTLTSAKNQDLDIGDDKIHDLTINNDTDARINYLAANGSIDGDLTITRGIFDTFNRTLTVDGDCSIAADGKLEANVNGGKDVTLGSLTIASGGIYNATRETTTITDESSGNYAFENQGTFTHNNGKVLIDFDTPNKNDNTDVKCNEFYDFEIKMNGTSYSTIFRDLSGNTVTFLGDLTITQGKFDDNVNADDYVIHGNTIVESNGFFGTATNWHTGDITHHGLVVLNGGTYYRSDAGGTVKMGGIRNIGGSVL